jgi:hypothetical protein
MIFLSKWLQRILLTTFFLFSLLNLQSAVCFISQCFKEEYAVLCSYNINNSKLQKNYLIFGTQSEILFKTIKSIKQ